MICKLEVNLDTDLPYWVDKASFISNFDQADFNNRNIQAVTDAYLQDWFSTDKNGNQCFLIPPVYVQDRVTQFISGRHRTAVLLNHMKTIPLSFDSRALTSSDQNWINSVTSNAINIASDIIELPNLPIKVSLP